MSDAPATPRLASPPVLKSLDRVVLRFAGDSGDGVQLTGNQFTTTTAAIGNDLATLPDFPAEIRAPAGTLPGVSAFQISFSDHDIHTPGDAPDALVAMNPAALRANVSDLVPGGTLIVNVDAFDERGLDKAGYTRNPLEDGSLAGYRLFPVRLVTLTRNALKDSPLSTRDKERCKNFFALGMMLYLYQRPLDHSLRWIAAKFKDRPLLAEANRMALSAGWAYCEAGEVFPAVYRVSPASFKPGTYRNIVGNAALSLGLVAASSKAQLPLFFGSYPITPASTILHELSQLKQFGVITFQAEDEIAAVTSAIGAAFGGALGVTASSGPGIALKTEALGLAVMTELPLVVIDIQRSGPSTGMPTKTEQADLFQAVFGRNSESPIPVLAASTPADCFSAAFEACRIAVEHMTPVILLSDGYLASGSEPWRVPLESELPSIRPPIVRHAPAEGWEPYSRDLETLARFWALPGTPGLEHRIGGLEKEEGSGHVSYDGANHELMVRTRAEKVARIARDYPPTRVNGDPAGELLIVGWGSTQGSILGALQRLRGAGLSVGHVHLRHIHPLPPDLGEILARFEHVLVPEMNLGQLAFLLRASFLRDVVSLAKVWGQPFRSQEIEQRARAILKKDVASPLESLP
ncbi:MAG: 2-oxoacid:acceptor oxidoreductase subunit alpha [Planctomycetota bacterium]